ncbi:uncharacterized protein LOC131011895 [Salvia miltiorrhiza]|uniref:uncharacterized protein LOC131011895 n=1 Tax=Salvia miltiorrhiza TaxID=226208 RepID=UPI0025AB738C|nr:uncharacterized protein LOC131011895 [Salvia miltiorrhiza]XP_057795775.1 uncharacterized protein LOC131011895 [Salvia miltiorrhiza]
MEQVIVALNRVASSNFVVNTFMGAIFCVLAGRSWAQGQTVRALEEENEALLKSNKQMKSTIWEWKQTLYAEAKANPKKALVPLSTLQTIYGDVVSPVPESAGEDDEEENPSKAKIII